MFKQQRRRPSKRWRELLKSARRLQRRFPPVAETEDLATLRRRIGQIDRHLESLQRGLTTVSNPMLISITTISLTVMLSSLVAYVQAPSLTPLAGVGLGLVFLIVALRDFALDIRRDRLAINWSGRRRLQYLAAAAAWEALDASRRHDELVAALAQLASPRRRWWWRRP